MGVIIDEKLTWEPHIDQMCKKLASVCGILSKVRHYLNRNALMLIYNSLVESGLRYGILSWGTASKKQLDRVRVLQNKALRFINFSSIDTTMLPIYAHYKVLPLSKLILHRQVIHMYCFENNLLPTAFNSYCIRPSHSYATRYLKNNYVIPKYDSKLAEKSIKTIGSKIWASVPNEAKILPFQNSFSKFMKNIYIDSLPTEISSGRHILNNNTLPSSESTTLEQIFLDETPNEDFPGFELSLKDKSFSTKLQSRTSLVLTLA